MEELVDTWTQKPKDSHKTYSRVFSESIAQTKIIVDQQFLIFTLIYSMKLP